MLVSLTMSYKVWFGSEMAASICNINPRKQLGGLFTVDGFSLQCVTLEDDC
jgi:hypothetical protein